MGNISFAVRALSGMAAGLALTGAAVAAGFGQELTQALSAAG